jgi:hypothetical protein
MTHVVSAVAILAVLLSPMVVLVGVMLLVEARERAHTRVISRQIMLTDAVHAELGALVAPVVEKPAFRPWRVTFALPAGRAAEVGRLISITDRVLGAELASPDDLRIVFTRSAPVRRAYAA